MLSWRQQIQLYIKTRQKWRKVQGNKDIFSVLCREKVIYTEIIMVFLLYYANMLNLIMLIVISQWNNCPRVDLSLHSTILSWFRANHVLSGKTADTICIVFGLTQPGLEPTNKLTSTPLMWLKCIRRYCPCCCKYHTWLLSSFHFAIN
jgi:hypothetical protein